MSQDIHVLRNDSKNITFGLTKAIHDYIDSLVDRIEALQKACEANREAVKTLADTNARLVALLEKLDG